MSLGIQVAYKIVHGTQHDVYVYATLDNNYPTGGYQLTPAMFGLNTFYPVETTQGAETLSVVYPMVAGGGFSSGAGAFSFDVNPTNGKLMAFTIGTTPAQVAGASAALNGITVLLYGFGY